MNRDIFRAYDIRGIYGVDFQPGDFYEIACAYANLFHPKSVVLGHDVRWSSHQLWQQVARGLQDSGVDVLNLGRISTDMLYFATVDYQVEGGITISASHNPSEYNGMKIIRRNAAPLSANTGLLNLRDAVERKTLFRKQTTPARGTFQTVPFLNAYLAHIRSFVNLHQLSARRIVVNANGGLAGQVVEQLLARTPIQIYEGLFTEPDGTFSGIPAGRPDPLRPENRELTTKAVRQMGADLAVAWDADADRCFFFDENGVFVEGCYITALLAEKLLQEKGEGIVVFDPRAVWAVEDAVVSANGTPLLSRCGHSFIKTRIREIDALFAGETSGHYYFRDNFYADNGMIPFLLVLEYLDTSKTSLAESVGRLRSAYPVSGEINFSFETHGHRQEAMDMIKAGVNCLGNGACIETPIDGLSVRFNRRSDSLTSRDSGCGCWRFNLRESNTEPLLRLNVESIENEDLLIEQTLKISEKLQGIGGNQETQFRWETDVLRSPKDS